MDNKIKIHNLTTKTSYVLNKKIIIKIICFYIIAFIVSAIIINRICRLDYVPSSSMKNTIQTGDNIITNKISYVFNKKPERGDIINFITPDSREQYVKRVIGLPNETIWIRNGIVYVNDIPLNENYTIPFIEEDCGAYIVPEGKYFVLGDNREDSYDSRYWMVKYVNADDILGKIVACYNSKENLGLVLFELIFNKKNGLRINSFFY